MAELNRPIKPPFVPEPLPGETAPPLAKHAYDIVQRATIKSLHEKVEDEVANVVLRNLPKTSSSTGGSWVPSAPGSARKPESEATHIPPGGGPVKRTPEPSETERLRILDEHADFLRKHGPDRFRPTTPLLPANLKTATSNLTPEPGPVEIREAAGRAAQQATYEAIPLKERRERANKLFNERRGAGRVPDIMEGQEIGDGKYIDPITRQTRRRVVGAAVTKVPSDVIEVARTIAGRHYRDTFEDQPISSNSKKTHPAFEKTSHYRSPLKYMETHMDIKNPQQHIEKNYSHALSRPGNAPAMAPSAPAKPFKSRSKEFMEAYLKNPLSAFKGEGE